MYGQIEKGAFRWKTTWYLLGASVLARSLRSVQMPWSPLIFCTRSNDHFTSADVIAAPSENFTFFRRPHVHVLRFFEWVQPVESTGASFAPFGKPYSPSYMFRSAVNES